VKVAQAVGEALAQLGVRRVFGLLGSGNFVVTNARFQLQDQAKHLQPLQLVLLEKIYIRRATSRRRSGMTWL